MRDVAKSKDLLLCETIATQTQKHGRKNLIAKIIGWLNQLASGLDISLPPERAITIASSILDVYTYDSLEDVREALKNARQGVYDWGMEKRGVINMMIIKYWMSEHLNKKTDERVKEQQKYKSKQEDGLKGVDYEAFKVRQKKEKSQKDELSEKEKGYNEFKAKFLAERQNKSK